MNQSKIYARIFVNFLLTVVGILLVVLLGPKLLRFFMPFVIAFVISSIANPIVRFMEKKIKIARKYSSVFMIVLVLGAVVGVLYLLIAFLVKQIMNLYEDRFALYNEVATILDNFTDKLGGILEKLPMSLQETLDNLQSSLSAWAQNFLASIELPGISAVGSYVGSVVEIIFFAIITVLAAYFLTAERDNMGDWLTKVMPESVKRYYHMIMDSFKKAVGGYFKAQFKIMLILVIIMFVGFEILNISYSFLLAFVIAFLDFLPVFGTGAVFWPWLVVDIVVGDYKQAIFLGILYLVCQLVKQILQPKMVGDSVGINPLAALLYMFIGYKFAGVIGMIIGIPVGMIIVNLYQAGLFDQLIKGIKIIVHDINEFRKY
ncbi:MAG: sporulation integral membrane protein YtvI [Lachnospiraceae bacterium]|nr:sporulation integral membrane protein YtvI [Lachnospiraceae bacterium]